MLVGDIGKQTIRQRLPIPMLQLTGGVLLMIDRQLWHLIDHR